MYIKIDIPENYKDIDPIVEEVWYLAQNEEFQKVLARIRKRYHIDPEKVRLNRSAFYKSLEFSELLSYEKSVYQEIILRCRGIMSQHEYEFVNCLKHYIDTGKLVSMSQGKLSAPYPRINIYPVKTKVVITVYADFDTTNTQITDLIKSKKEDIRKEQKKLGKAKFKDTNFRLNIEKWTKKRIDGKTFSKIANEYGNKYKYDTEWYLKDLVSYIDNRIKQSFS